MEPIYIDADGRMIFEKDGRYFMSKKRTAANCIDCGAEVPRGKDMCGDCAESYGFAAVAR